jgi:peptidoglycan/LPS O-acetylase OafA/YrhL
MNPNTTHAAPRLEYLDALRGLAILGVICVHCSIFAGGDIIYQRFATAAANGVQLFFMVSAFTIFLTLERFKDRETHYVRNFFIRRFFRILPMFWVGIALYCFVPMREVTTTPIVVTAFDYALTAVCLHGFHPYSINSVVPGGWSIGVEATFYFLAPFLFCLVTGWKRALSFLLGTLLIFKIVNKSFDYMYHHHLIWNEVSALIYGNFLYWWFPSQLPVFACGILAYFISRSLPVEFLTKQNGWLLLATAAILIQSAVGVASLGIIPIPGQLYFAIGFLFLFLGLKCHPAEVLVNSFTRFLGKISYSVYLLHFSILLLALKCSQYFAPKLAAHHTAQFLFLFIVTVILAIPAAWLTYQFIEAPFISLGSRLVKYSESKPPR